MPYHGERNGRSNRMLASAPRPVIGRPSASPPVQAHLPALTGLRFLAALMVVGFHFGRGVVDAAHIPAPLANIVHRGNLGVDLFFVLSGFILSYSYLNMRGQL